jgi:hypothetical protein
MRNGRGDTRAKPTAVWALSRRYRKVIAAADTGNRIRNLVIQSRCIITTMEYLYKLVVGITLLVSFFIDELHPLHASPVVSPFNIATAAPSRTAIASTTTEWHEVFRIDEDGLSINPSNGFYLQGTRWRLTFSCSNNTDSITTLDGYFEPVDALTLSSTSTFDQLFADSVSCPFNATVYYNNEPSGNYEITVLTTAKYSVQIDDYY